MKTLTNTTKQSRARGRKVLLSLGIALLLMSPMQASASWSFGDAVKIVKKVGGKVVKKVVLPATVVLGGVASAADAYVHNKSTAEILGSGIGGAAQKIGDSVKETMEDIETIGSAAVKIYHEN